MYLYNSNGDKAYAEKEQLAALIEAGWSKTPPKGKKAAEVEVEVETEEELLGEDETESSEKVEESTEVGEEAAPKKIGKKTIQKKK